jgi:transposase
MYISPAEKRRILQAYDRCKNPGERGALLRKERVYSSMISGWRKHDRSALIVPKRGPKANPAVAQRKRDEQLTRENVRLRRELDRAKAIIEVQKKLCTLLGLPTAEDPEGKN